MQASTSCRSVRQLQAVDSLRRMFVVVQEGRL